MEQIKENLKRIQELSQSKPDYLSPEWIELHELIHETSQLLGAI